ncbi:uncharacterized protein LOC128174062 [Crassostrea angulata]|uniref:uncharacterized protein LOC128174062 n=1 Tax=Magallana angulata TaxID=2784310 RepID=UPI0022B1D2B6|nr:uncharacterized protein LOC128174062 [Crassostrea angulata]
MEQNVTFLWTDAYKAVNGSKESKKILTNTILISFGIPICLENFLAIVVLLKSSRLIDQVRILSINLAITDCLSGLLLSIPDDVFGGCLLKKYFTAPFINAIPNVDYTSKAMRLLMAVTAGVMFLNSAINPVLYVWRFTESRYQLKKLLFFWNAEKLKKLESERNSFFASYNINSSDSRQ